MVGSQPRLFLQRQLCRRAARRIAADGHNIVTNTETAFRNAAFVRFCVNSNSESNHHAASCCICSSNCLLDSEHKAAFVSSCAACYCYYGLSSVPAPQEIMAHFDSGVTR